METRKTFGRIMDEKSIAESIVRSIVGKRGLQVRRKDKDLMQDTGGVSKGRKREPHKKPPRDDSKNRYRTKDLTPEQRDEDTHNDKDEPVGRKTKRKGNVHPLDLTQEGEWAGLDVPEDNYHRRVYSALWNVLENATGTSEKDFHGQDEIKEMCEEVVRSPEAEEIIQRFQTQGCRPEYCAESIYDQMR